MAWKPRVLLLAVLDAVLFASAWVLSYNFRFPDGIPAAASTLGDNYLLQMKLVLPWMVLSHVGLYWAFHLYRGVLRYAGTTELKSIFAATGIHLGAWLLISTVLGSQSQFLELPQRQLTDGSFEVLRISYGILCIYAMMAVLMTGAVRIAPRMFQESTAKSEAADAPRTLVVGAGDAADSALRAISREGSTQFRPVCAVTANASRVGSRMHGIPVVGTIEKIPEVIRDNMIQKVLIALDEESPTELRRVISACESTGLAFRIIPSLKKIAKGGLDASAIREIEIEDLLGREPVRLKLDADKNYIAGKTVLITGAGGSIGSELARQSAAAGAEKIILLGKGENSIFAIANEIHRSFPTIVVEPLIADIRDEERIATIFRTHKPAIVFHAAAHKHVPLMESSPDEAIKNNILGTANVAVQAEAHGVERFVLISTDKAVRPSSVMGATKRYSEIIALSLAQKSRCVFQAVRFGNVLGSRGSVIPHFREQIRTGGPVTITHPDVSRYFMTIPEAVSLVLQAGRRGENGGLYLLDMGQPVKIVDLARNMIVLSGLRPEVDIKIEYIGLRPGEKLNESLVTEVEKAERTNVAKLYLAARSDARALTEVLDELQNFQLLADRGDIEGIYSFLQQVIPDYYPAGREDHSDDGLRKQINALAARRQRPVSQAEVTQVDESLFAMEQPDLLDELDQAAREREAAAISDVYESSIAADSPYEAIRKFVDLVFRQAVHDRASEIHFEPSLAGLTIRFIVDSVPVEAPSPPKAWRNQILSRVKELAGMDVSQMRVPQDGIIKASYPDLSIELHVASTPGIYGESIILKITHVSSASDEDFIRDPAEAETLPPLFAVTAPPAFEEPHVKQADEILGDDLFEQFQEPHGQDARNTGADVTMMDDAADEPIPGSSLLYYGESSEYAIDPRDMIAGAGALGELNPQEPVDAAHSLPIHMELPSGDLAAMAMPPIINDPELREPTTQEELEALGLSAPPLEPEMFAPVPEAVQPPPLVDATASEHINREEFDYDMASTEMKNGCLLALRVAKGIDPDTLNLLVQQLESRVLTDIDRVVALLESDADGQALPVTVSAIVKDGRSEASAIAEALQNNPEAGILVVFSSEVVFASDALEQIRAALTGNNVLAFSNYHEDKDGVVTDVKLHDHEGCPHERFEFGPVIAYRTAAIQKVGGVREDLKFAWEYDLQLKLDEIGDFKRIGNFSYTRFVPVVVDSKGSKVFSPGMGPLGGFSYVFYPEDMEREVTSVFEEALKRRGAWIDQPSVPVNHGAQKFETLASIVIPILNRVKYIENAIEKVQSGTFQSFEMIIVDNGSTDGTIELVKKIAAADSRIRLIHGKGGSIASALNEGIKAAHGKYICQLDSDDEYAPDCLEQMIGHLEGHPKCGLAISYYRLMDEHGVVISDVAPITHGGYSRNQILRRDGAGAVRIFPKAVLTEFGFYDEEHYGNFGEDYDMVLKTGEKYDVDRVHKVLYHYRRHSDNTDVTRDPAMKYQNKNRARQEGLKRRRAINAKLGKQATAPAYKPFDYP
ncbi:hypothetical protein BH09SUM1_BH09SUM1_25480 [soil metagenome]